jgi:hypothetical protein
VHSPQQPGQVDHTEQLTGVRIVDGGCRAGPVLDDLAEVLGGEDLDGVVRRQGRPDSIRPRTFLTPQRAFGEVHGVCCLGTNPGVALELEENAVCVAHHDQVLRLVGDARQAATNQRRRLSQRMDVPTCQRRVTIGGHRGQPAPRGVDSGVERAAPRVGDRCTHQTYPALADELFPFPSHCAGMETGRRGLVNGQPLITGHLLPPSTQPSWGLGLRLAWGLSKRQSPEPKSLSRTRRAGPCSAVRRNG